MTKLCDKCGNVTKYCTCPKQSTELEGIIAEWREWFSTKGVFLDVIEGPNQTEPFLTKAYHSGHTAGQAAEREKWIDKIASSLNKD